MEITPEYTYKLLGCAVEVHRTVGPGLLEDVYHKLLRKELELNGFFVEEEVPVVINYKGLKVGYPLHIDLLVDHQVVLELKSCEELKPVFFKQLLTYMRLTHCHLGYLINFKVDQLKNGGIHRMVDNFNEVR